MATDPYAAPKSHVADVPSPAVDGTFVAAGQSVAAGNGWTWIADAWELNKLQRATWIGIFVLFAIAVIGLSVIPVIGTLILYLVVPLLYGGIVLGCEAQRRGERLEVGHLFAGFRNHTGKLLVIGVFILVAFVAIIALIFVIFGAGIAGIMMGSGADPDTAMLAAGGATILLGGLVALGLSVPVYMAFWFSTPLVILNGFEVGAALKTSFFACLKNIIPFMVWGIITFLLAILASIPLALGWLLLGPVLLASVYTSYRDIFYTR
jgi:uncharacterized membrane protein